MHVTHRSRKPKNARLDSSDDENADIPSTSNRRNRITHSRQSNDSNAPPPRTGNDVRAMVKKALEMARNKKNKTSVQNCFSQKNVLDDFTPEELSSDAVNIQEIATILDASQQMYSFRVDKVFLDARSTQQDIFKGSVLSSDKNTSGLEELDSTMDANTVSRKRRKPVCGELVFGEELDNAIGNEEEDDIGNEDVDDRVLRKIDGQKKESNRVENGEENEEAEINDDGHVEWNDKDDFDIKVDELLAERIVRRENRKDNISAQCVLDNAAIELQNTDIDWLKANTYYQKAVRGGADEKSSRLNMVTYYGITSDNGRCIYLHPRVAEDETTRTAASPSDVVIDVVHNSRMILKNAMAPTPLNIPNCLMLDVPNRVHHGQQILSQIQSSTLGCLPPGTPRGVNDTSIFDMTMLPSVSRSLRHTRPVSRVGNGSPEDTVEPMSVDRTLSVNTNVDDEPPSAYSVCANPQIDQTVIELPEYNEILMDPVLEVFQNEDSSLNVRGLDSLLERRVEQIEQGEDKDLWKQGWQAEEWDEDPDHKNVESQFIKASTIDNYVHMSDYMTNAEVMVMKIYKPDYHRLEQNLTDKDKAEGKRVMQPGKYFFIRQPFDMPKNYPADPFEDEEDLGNEVEMDVDEGQDDEFFDEPVLNLSGIDEQIEEQDALDAELENRIGEVAKTNGDIIEDQIVDALLNPENDDFASPHHSFGGDDGDIGEEDVHDLIDGAPKQQLRSDAVETFKNLGKEDDSHWKQGDKPVKGETSKKKEKKERKIRKKITIEDFEHYFTPSTAEKRSELCSRNVTKASSTTWKTDDAIYLKTMPSEKKPHIAYEFDSLCKFGLLFKDRYGTLRFERVSKKGRKADELIAEEAKGPAVDNDCLNWLLTFGGFQCFQQTPKPTVPTDEVNNDESYVGDATFDMGDDYVDCRYDDNEDEKHMKNRQREEAMGKMTEEGKRKYLGVTQEADMMRQKMRLAHHAKHADSDSSSDDDDDYNEGNKRNLKAKNLDAVKFKKTIAEILNNKHFSAPSMQSVLNHVTLESSRRQEDQENEELQGTQFTNLMNVFKVPMPTESQSTDVVSVVAQLTDVPEYVEEDVDILRNNNNASGLDGEHAGPHHKVVVDGVHTLQSLTLCMPHRMLEKRVQPAYVLSFMLHLCNDNNLRLIQDQTNKNWLTDVLILNSSDELPRGLELGQEIATDKLWNECHDPCAQYYQEVPPMPEATDATIADDRLLSFATPSTSINKSTPQSSKNNVPKKAKRKLFEKKNLETLAEETEETEPGDDDIDADVDSDAEVNDDEQDV